MYILLFVADIHDIYENAVLRTCSETFGFPSGCHDISRYMEVANMSVRVKNEPGISEVHGITCFCSSDMCNGVKITETGGGSALQTSDSHNLMIICVLAMAALITLSAANGD